VAGENVNRRETVLCREAGSGERGGSVRSEQEAGLGFQVMKGE
jgi:hypothetical protein